MKYLKLVNMPIKLLSCSKYGSDSKKIPWEKCGFNPTLLSIKSIQFQDGENHYSYLPISDEKLLNSCFDLIKEDAATLGEDSTADIIDADYIELTNLKLTQSQ